MAAGSSSSQVGIVYFLVPLNDKLQEDPSISLISISLQAPNILGRNSLPVTDKCLSRNHLSLTTSPEGSATLRVEGTNPVVRSQDQRRKLLYREKLTFRSGDIIELILGHHFFKYVSLGSERNTTSPNNQKRSLNEGTKVIEGGAVTQKKMRQVLEDEAYARKLQAELNPGSLGKNNSSEAICHFSLPEDKLPLTFRLMRVKGLPTWANTNAVSIGDVIQGNVLFAVLSNYMVDIDWLLSACPALKRIPHVLVIHGEGDGTLEYMKWPEFSVNLPDLGKFSINSSFFKKFDYSNASVRLIASIPGYHSSPNLKKWGHTKLRTVLQDCVFDKEFQKSPLVYQGYVAGNAIPSPQKNVEKDFLKKYWAKWKATHTARRLTGRAREMKVIVSLAYGKLVKEERRFTCSFAR